mgnify:CR=1 FL=1|tara:strand:+ start:1236 stop:1517 length:282 start_codon:yes stop_codon:yes gene_type:complete
MIDGFLEGIESFFVDLVDDLSELAKDALDELGLREMFDQLLNTAPIQTLLEYTPLINELLYLPIVASVFATEFAIILTLIIFKIVVKVIPTVW